MASSVGAGVPRGVALPRAAGGPAAGLVTQAELAARAGVSVATISKLEQRGRDSTAALATARKLAAALDVEPAGAHGAP